MDDLECIVCGDVAMHSLDDGDELGDWETLDDLEAGVGQSAPLCLECYDIVLSEGWEAVTG